MNEGLAILAGIENLEHQEDANRFPRDRHFYRDCLQSLSDIKFCKKFRLTKELTIELIDTVSEYVNPRTRVSALSVQEMVLIALRFYASGSYQACVGESQDLGVSQASVSRCLNLITDILNRPEIFHTYVKFPENMEQLNSLRKRFYEKFQLPGIIGCVDCTHVAIIAPKRNNPLEPEHIFVNRKGYHSINVQIVCDENMKILHLNARFPGSTHDSYIFQNSNVHQALINLTGNGNEGYFVIGDSGYPLRPWLMTPLQAPNTVREIEYNRRFKSARSTVETCNGLLKMRFRCLLKHRVLHYALQKCSKIINACAVLHNICVNNNVELFLEENEEEEDEDIDLGQIPVVAPPEDDIRNRNRNPQLVRGESIRRGIIQSIRL